MKGGSESKGIPNERGFRMKGDFDESFDDNGTDDLPTFIYAMVVPTTYLGIAGENFPQKSLRTYS